MLFESGFRSAEEDEDTGSTRGVEGRGVREGDGMWYFALEDNGRGDEDRFSMEDGGKGSDELSG